MRVLFFIPTFNDQEGLEDLVKELIVAYPSSTILVIDDGSHSRICLETTSPQIILYRLPINLGLGTSTSIAIDFGLDYGYDFFVRLDADGQHPVGEISGLLTPLIEKRADVVWGERRNQTLRGSHRQLMGATVKKVTALMGRWVFGSSVQDWFTGFFALNKIAMNKAGKAYLVRYCEVQMLSLFYENELIIYSHKIDQFERNYGTSSIGWLNGFMIILRALLIIIMHGIGMAPR